MSATNNIKKLLDIQDEHITFEGDCVHEEEYKGKICTFVTGKLIMTLSIVKNAMQKI